jgi:hypothetical protein
VGHGIGVLKVFKESCGAEVLVEGGWVGLGWVGLGVFFFFPHAICWRREGGEEERAKPSM